MKSNNRRLYRRILAFMLVVLLVLPQGLSSIGVKAEGGITATTTVSGSSVNVSFSGEDDYVITKAELYVDGTLLGSQEKTEGARQFDFSGIYRRKDSVVSYKIYKTNESSEFEEITDVFDSSANGYVLPDNTFSVDSSNIVNSLSDDKKSVNISLTGLDGIPAYLSDFADSVEIVYSGTIVGGPVNLTDQTSISVDLNSNVNGKNLSVVYSKGGSQVHEYTITGTWSKPSFKISISDDNKVVVEKVDAEDSSSISDYDSTVTIKVGKNESKTINTSDLNGLSIENIDGTTQYVKENDEVKLSFTKDDANEVIQNLDSLSSKRSNYYSLEIQGSNVGLENSDINKIDGKYAILNTYSNDIILVTDPGYAVLKINGSSVDNDKVTVKSNSEKKIITEYNYGLISNDTVITVDTTDFRGAVNGPDEAYLLVPYKLSLSTNLPKYINYSFSYDNQLISITDNDKTFKIITEDLYNNYPLSYKLVTNVDGKEIVLETCNVKAKIDDAIVEFAKYAEEQGIKFTTGNTIVINENYSFGYIAPHYDQYKIQKDPTYSYIGWNNLDNASEMDLTISVNSVTHENDGRIKCFFRTLDKKDNSDGKYSEVEIDVLIDTIPPEFESAPEFKVGNIVTTEADFVQKSNLKKSISYRVIDSQDKTTDVSGVAKSYYAVSSDLSKHIELPDGNEIEFDGPIFDETTYIQFFLYDNAGNLNDTYKYTIGKIVSLKVENGIPDKNVKKVDDVYYVNDGDTISFKVYGDDDIIDEISIVSADDKISLIRDVDYSVVKETEKGENGETQYTVTYKNVAKNTEDGKYSIHVKAEDSKAGIPSVESDDFTFIIDNTIPVIDYNKIIDNKYINKNLNTKDNSGNSEIKLINDIVDDNLLKMKAKVSKTSEYGKTQTDYSETKKRELESLEDGKYKNCTVNEGYYELTYYAEDKAGNRSETLKKKFTFDITAPEKDGKDGIKISVDGNGQIASDNSYEDFKFFDNKMINVNVTLLDEVSGVASIKVTEDGVVIPSDFNKVADGNGGYKYTVTFKVDPTYKGKIGITAYDKAGNEYVAEIAGDTFAGIIAENDTAQSSVSLSTTPSKEKVFVEAGVETEYYNTNPSVGISAGDTISGIKRIDVNVLNNPYIYTKNKNIVTKKDETFTLSNEGEYSVRATLTDNAGNTMPSNTKRIIIDKTVPVISSNVETVAKEYNNADVSVGVTIEEKYLNNNNTTIKIYNNGSLEKTITGGFSTSGTTNTSSIPFTSDGKYYFTVETTDKAGNTAQMYKSKEFTVDKTNPKLTLTFNNNNVRNERYYNAERIGTLTVEEHNFDASLVDVKVNVTDSAEGVGTPSIGGFSSSGDTHTASIPFSQDATYEITVSAKDKADNNSDQTITESFVVDLTDPEIKFSNVEEETLYSGIVRPDVEVTDRNYDNSGTTITLVSSRDNGAAAKNLEDTYKVSSIANGEKFTYDNFKNEEANDDYYTIKAVAQDKAGNTSEKTIGFMVNRFGSYFTLNDYTAQLVKAVYTNLEGDDDIVISAHNLADIEESKVYFTVGEDTKTLDENDGYKITKKTGDDHWNVSSYTFDKSLFESEGEYNIVVSTKDSEGNVADNEAKDAPVSFIIDRTAPEYIVSGIEDGQNYEDQDKVSGTIELHDNIGVAKADVTIDGTKSTYEGKELDDMNYSVPVEFSKGSHTIEVKVYDLAGNESDDDDGISFSVNQTAAERAIAKATKSFWWIFVIIGAVAAAGIIIFVVAKRKSEE